MLLFIIHNLVDKRKGFYSSDSQSSSCRFHFTSRLPRFTPHDNPLKGITGRCEESRVSVFYSKENFDFSSEYIK